MIVGGIKENKKKMHMGVFIINQILSLKSYFVSGWKTAP